jgi:hypothetical protein
MRTKIIRPAGNGTDQQFTQTTHHCTETRICVQCGVPKPIEDMVPDRHAKNGHRSKCKKCRAEYDQRRYRAQRDYILARCAAEPGVGWAANHRRRVRRYGLGSTTECITRAELVAKWGDHCLHCRTGVFEQIYHLIPVAAGGPHILGNVVPCCRRCNIQKRWVFDRWIIRDHREAWAEHASRLRDWGNIAAHSAPQAPSPPDSRPAPSATKLSPPTLSLRRF